jgi:hypothetical protein
LPLIHSHYVSIDRTRVHKGVVIHNRDAVVYALVDVRNIRDVVRRVVVINVRDLRDVHPRVGDIHVLHIARTGTIPGNEHVSGS